MTRSKSGNKITDPKQALDTAKRYLRSNLLDSVAGPRPAPMAEIKGADVIESAATDLQFWNGTDYADRLDYARVYCYLAARAPKRADPVCYARTIPYADMVVGSLGYPKEQAKKVFESGIYPFDQMLQAAGAVESEDFPQQHNYDSSAHRFEGKKGEALAECFVPAIGAAMGKKGSGDGPAKAVLQFLKQPDNTRRCQIFYAQLMGLAAQNILGLHNRAPQQARGIAKIVAENCETTLSPIMLQIVQKVAKGSPARRVSTRETRVRPPHPARSSR